MAKIKNRDDDTLIITERGSDVQVLTIKHAVARDYFNEGHNYPLGEDFDMALDEVQAAVQKGTPAVLILIIEADGE